MDMKTAVSIPEALFRAAEQEARKLAISRSAFYAQALEAFLEARGQHQVTEPLNKVYAEHPSKVDPILARIQRLSLDRDEW